MAMEDKQSDIHIYVDGTIPKVSSRMYRFLILEPGTDFS